MCAKKNCDIYKFKLKKKKKKKKKNVSESSCIVRPCGFNDLLPDLGKKKKRKKFFETKISSVQIYKTKYPKKDKAENLDYITCNISQEFWNKKIEANPKELINIPRCCVTKEIKQLILTKYPQYVDKIPANKITHEDRLFILEHSIENFKKISSERIDPFFLSMAIKHNSGIIKTMPIDFFIPQIIMFIIKSYPNYINYIPSSKLTEKACKYLFDKYGARYFDKIPKKYYTNKMFSYARKKGNGGNEMLSTLDTLDYHEMKWGNE